MKKQIMLAILLLMGVVASESVWAQAPSVKETVDKAAVAKAQAIRAKAERLKAKKNADKRRINALLVEAADMETNAHKLGNKCKQGSHKDIQTIKAHHKNCEQCHSVEIKDGECARVPGDHKHYYCYCNC